MHTFTHLAHFSACYQLGFHAKTQGSWLLSGIVVYLGVKYAAIKSCQLLNLPTLLSLKDSLKDSLIHPQYTTLLIQEGDFVWDTCLGFWPVLELELHIVWSNSSLLGWLELLIRDENTMQYISMTCTVSHSALMLWPPWVSNSDNNFPYDRYQSYIALKTGITCTSL